MIEVDGIGVVVERKMDSVVGNLVVLDVNDDD